jgi:hypothetical protein
MIVYGSWSRAAGQPLSIDLRRKIFLLSLDNKIIAMSHYICIVVIHAVELHISLFNSSGAADAASQFTWF